MLKINTPDVSCEQQNVELSEEEIKRIALAKMQKKWAREKRYPAVLHVGQLAVVLTMALDEIHALVELANGRPDDPVLPGDGDSWPITWKELLCELAGWKWTVNQAIGKLGGEFTDDVRDALLEAGYDGGDDDGEEEGEDLEDEKDTLAMVTADTPSVVELPPHRGTPYWMQ